MLTKNLTLNSKTVMRQMNSGGVIQNQRLLFKNEATVMF